MSVLSTLRFISDFLFTHNNWKDKKYRGHLHPIIASLFTMLIYLATANVLDEFFDTKLQFNISRSARIGVSAGILLYLIFMFAVRYMQSGSHVIYEMMWACNVALISAAFAIFKGSPFMLAASLAMVSTDQVLWYVDLLSYVIFKKFPIGVAKYLTWPTTTRLRMMTSFHHILFIPLCLSLLKNQPTLPKNAWVASCGMSIVLTLLSRLFAPHSIDNGHEIVYLNLNLSRELWKDVKINTLKAFDKSPWYIAITMSNFIWNIGDLIAFGLLDQIFTRLK